MRITALLENTSVSPAYTAKHGLCLYVETQKHKLLFDTGPDDSFLHNAKKLGVDIAGVDTLVLSHGHNDHGGGLAAFVKANTTATIYAHKTAFEQHSLRAGPLRLNIGVLVPQGAEERLVLLEGTQQINSEMLVFSDVAGDAELRGNRILLEKQNGRHVPDSFAHEQNLILTENGRNTLLCGCCHRGIANIMAAARRHCGEVHNTVGGFHLYKETRDSVQEVASHLTACDTQLYTCHCTGQKAFSHMKEILGEQLSPLSTGQTLEL